jgi:hypothetical protein
VKTSNLTSLTINVVVHQEHNLCLDGNGANRCWTQCTHDGDPKGCCTVNLPVDATRPHREIEAKVTSIIVTLQHVMFRQFFRLIKIK